MCLSYCAAGTTASAFQAPLGEGEQTLARVQDPKLSFWQGPQGTPWLWFSTTALHLQPLNADLIQSYPSMQNINNITYKGQKKKNSTNLNQFFFCEIYIWIKKETL